MGRATMAAFRQPMSLAPNAARTPVAVRDKADEDRRADIGEAVG